VGESQNSIKIDMNIEMRGAKEVKDEKILHIVQTVPVESPRDAAVVLDRPLPSRALHVLSE
jgi:hypothetical protein